MLHPLVWSLWSFDTTAWRQKDQRVRTANDFPPQSPDLILHHHVKGHWKPSAWWDNRSPCSQTIKLFLLLPLCSFSIFKPSTSFAKTRFYSWHFKSQISDIAADCLWFLVISVYKNQLAETLFRWVIHHFCSILFWLSKNLKSQLHNGALRIFKINLHSTRQ